MKLSGKKVMAVGMAKSGIAAAQLCHRYGAVVTLYDAKPAEALEDALVDLQGEGYERILGREPSEEELARQDYLVLSPGVPADLPFVERARALGAAVWGEVELASHFCQSPVIGITGTNGKTTTTTLVGEIMRAAYPPSLVAGNIGTPISQIVEQTQPGGYLTMELSSFQLETIQDFHPKIAAILNFTPDHLNRHKTFENYVAAKCRIYENQTSGDVCIFNYDDALCRQKGQELMRRADAPRVVYFSHTQETPGGVWTQYGCIMAQIEGKAVEVLPIQNMQIFGPHNEENAMAAVACALAAGVPLPVLREQLQAFRGVAHRIEPVGTVDGVRYYNDSKATNPDAAIKGLLAMPSKYTVLIGGGYDKGTPYDKWCQLFNGRVRRLILLGATQQDIYDCAVRQGYPAENIDRVQSLEEAVQKAAEAAQPGDSVLLSPACASWGMFDNYEQRGDQFRALVQDRMTQRR